MNSEPSGARGTILAGGIALVAGAVAFLSVFAYLAARFNYPDVLGGNAEDVLPALLATGSAGRAAWALYSVLPLVVIPGSVAAFEALRERAASPMRVGTLFASLAAVSMVLALMRWPSVHWELARAPLAGLVGYRHGHPGTDRHVAQRDACSRSCGGPQQLLLPAWMIGFGTWLIAERAPSRTAGRDHPAVSSSTVGAIS